MCEGWADILASRNPVDLPRNCVLSSEISFLGICCKGRAGGEL